MPLASGTSESATSVARPHLLLRILFSKGFAALVDQGVVSVANFASSLIVAKSCTKEEFGIYGLGFSMVVLLSAIPKSLVWTPYTTFAPRLESHDRLTKFTGSVTVHMLLIALVTGLALLVASFAQALMPNSDPLLGRLLLVLCPAIVLVMIREHARRLCLAWLRNEEVLVLDTLVSILQVGILWLVAWEGQLTGSNAYWAFGISSSITLFWLYLRRSEIRMERSQVKEDAKHNWQFSKWIFVGALAVMLANFLYRSLLAKFHSYSELANLTAVQTVVYLANPLLLGLSNFYGPTSATIFAKQGARALFGSVFKTFVGMGALLSLFCIFLAIFGDAVVVFLCKEEYAGLGQLVVMFGLATFSEHMMMPLECGFQAISHGKMLFSAAFIRLVFSVCLGTFLIWKLGAMGVAIGILVANVCVTSFMWFWFVRLTRAPASNP
ncbi:MAG: hypothetical protein R3C28_15560 [Pirellulaceae bacterium]